MPNNMHHHFTRFSDSSKFHTQWGNPRNRRKKNSATGPRFHGIMMSDYKNIMNDDWSKKKKKSVNEKHVESKSVKREKSEGSQGLWVGVGVVGGGGGSA